MANTVADRNQIQWAGSVTVRAQARLIHVVSIARNFQEGVGIMENTVVAGRTGALVDIREVAVDKELSREERISDLCGRSRILTVSNAGVSPYRPALPQAEPLWKNVLRESYGEPDFLGKGLTFPQGRGTI